MKLNNTSLGALFALCLCSGALNAATVPYSFDVDVDSGPRNGNLYSGDFSYDDATLTGFGEEYVALDSFNFSFESNALTLVDDTFAEAVFYDGDFLGISYNAATTDFSVSFIPGFFDLSEAYFAYDLAGDAGFGTLNVTAVPVPAALPLLLSGLGLFGLQRRRRSL
ncbi:MAG: VPLPA-CTERM sorting domain-containing protein [Gammaproteobacteria bacterium]|nr:VPLPA-CTERM sorting domain-containing protein [Gammaproteobacteria bacterium]MBU2479312.1 VPLPA-CTERM sorting domain-containing protein [Gammaproteobacteria bacterium]